MMIGITNSNTAQIGQVFTWAEISEIHRVRNGIHHRNGKLVSLLTDFGRINPCYPDFHGRTADEIHYTGFGRRGDQKLNASNQALLNAIESGHSVPLFNKLGTGQWEYQGEWRVVHGQYVFDEKQNRMLWKFTLNRT